MYQGEVPGIRETGIPDSDRRLFHGANLFQQFGGNVAAVKTFETSCEQSAGLQQPDKTQEDAHPIQASLPGCDARIESPEGMRDTRDPSLWKMHKRAARSSKKSGWHNTPGNGQVELD